MKGKYYNVNFVYEWVSSFLKFRMNQYSTQPNFNRIPETYYSNNALTELRRQVEVYLTRYVETACPRCNEVYDPFVNPPMILCLNRHRSCKRCVQSDESVWQNKTENTVELKRCPLPNCRQMITAQNFIRDQESIIYLVELNKKQKKPLEEQSSSRDCNQRTEIQERVQFIKRHSQQLQTELLYVSMYLLPRLQYKQRSIEAAQTNLQNQLNELNKRLRQLDKQSKRQNELQPSELEEEEIKDLLSMNYSIELIADLQNKIASAKSDEIKAENCKIVQYAFGQTKQEIKQNIPKYIPKNIIILPSQTDEVLSPQNPNQEKEVQAPLHIYVDIDPEQEDDISKIDMKKDEQVYAYLEDSVGKLLKRTKNLWKFLRIEKEITHFSQKQFIQLMCEQMKKIEQFSITEVYKFEGYQTFKDLLNYLIKQYTNKLYQSINQIMSSTDPITIARMRYFIHLMLKNYQDKICGQLPQTDPRQYYRYTKISRMQFKTYSIGGFIFFTTLTSCSYEGQPKFSHSPSQNQVRIKYTISVSQEEKDKQMFNSYLDISDMSKYSHQKQVLFFPYQIFLIQDIQYYEELKLAEVQLKQVPKKYIIQEIKKPENQMLQSILGTQKGVRPQEMLEVLSQTKNEMRQRINNFVNQKKDKINAKYEEKEAKLKEQFQDLIAYSEKNNLQELKKKIMRADTLEDITYLNLSSCKLKKIQFMSYFKKLKILSLWDNQIDLIQNLEHNKELKKLLLGKNNISNLKNLQTVSPFLNELSLYDNSLNVESAQYIKDKIKVFPQLGTLSISFNCKTAHENDQCYRILFELDQLNKELQEKGAFNPKTPKRWSIFPKLNIIQIYNSEKVSLQTKDEIKKVVNEMNRVNSELHKKRIGLMSQQKQSKRNQESSVEKNSPGQKNKANKPKTQKQLNHLESFNSILVFWYQ